MFRNLINLIKSNKVIFLFLIIGSFLRLYHLNFQSPWLDEIHTLNEANPKLSFNEVHDALLVAEPHPPLYFFIMNVVFKIFGYSTFIARIVSAIIGIAGLYSIYLLGKELFSKKVGKYAMILLSVNYFHIYYSQDARMYGLLFLTTTLSFYYLTKLIKTPTLKNTLIFGLVSTLMIYSHFFAVFTLFAQYIILLYYIIFPFNISRARFFKYSLISGLMTILLYIPTYKLILKTTEMKSIWIQMPSLDVYTQFFKDFFGQSETVLFFIVTLIIFYFIKLFDENQNQKNTINPIEDKNIFSFIVLFLWILITIIIPLIRTYTSLPMLVNRYFINILPAVLIMISIALSMINNKTVKYGMISILFVFSLSDIIIVKKYYTQPNKSQFREASEFVKSNSKPNEIIFSSLSWYFNYFFNEPKIIDKPFNSIISETKNDTTLLSPFWYINSHGNKFEISKENEQFFNENYVVDKNFEGYDAWAKRFTPKKFIKNDIKIDKFKPFSKPNYGNKIKAWIEKFDIQNDSIKIVGWSFIEKIDSKNSYIYLVFLNDNQYKVFLTTLINRPDITATENCGIDYNNSGFDLKLLKKELNKGIYRLGIYIKNDKKEGLLITDKVIDIK